ncbi:MAG: hypothetical protein LUI12_12755 [Clostridiales bacterium]|nr:hypothetical protein [Clostridiales bacterium]
MFKIKNDRIYPNLAPMTLSVKIPEDFWLVAFPDAGSPNDIVFRTSDGSATIEILIGYKTGDDTAQELLDNIEGCPEEYVEGPYPIEVNGMKGHYLYCASEIAQYVVLLDVEDLGLKSADSFYGTEEKSSVDRIQFSVSVSSEEGEEGRKAIHETMKNETIKELLYSINVE